MQHELHAACCGFSQRHSTQLESNTKFFSFIAETPTNLSNISARRAKMQICLRFSEPFPNYKSAPRQHNNTSTGEEKISIVGIAHIEQALKPNRLLKLKNRKKNQFFDEFHHYLCPVRISFEINTYLCSIIKI